MSIKFACSCGRQFTVGDEFAGIRTDCPDCGTPVTVPPAAPAPTSIENTESEKKKVKKEEDWLEGNLFVGLSAIFGGSIWLVLNLVNQGTITIPPLAICIFGVALSL